MTAKELTPIGSTVKNLDAIKSIVACASSIRTGGVNDLEDVLSPCISVCRVDADSGWCEGCLRTLDEIAAWSRLGNDAKRGVWRIIEQRAARSLATGKLPPGETP